MQFNEIRFPHTIIDLSHETPTIYQSNISPLYEVAQKRFACAHIEPKILFSATPFDSIEVQKINQTIINIQNFQSPKEIRPKDFNEFNLNGLIEATEEDVQFFLQREFSQNSQNSTLQKFTKEISSKGFITGSKKTLTGVRKFKTLTIEDLAKKYRPNGSHKFAELIKKKTTRWYYYTPEKLPKKRKTPSKPKNVKLAISNKKK